MYLRPSGESYFLSIQGQELLEQAIYHMKYDVKKLYNDSELWNDTMNVFFKKLGDHLITWDDYFDFTMGNESVTLGKFNVDPRYLRNEASLWFVAEIADYYLLDDLGLSVRKHKRRYLETAFDHQIDSNAWGRNLQHLTELTAKLKVLISYSTNDIAFKDPEFFSEKLLELLQKFTKNHELHEDEEYLFMFGTTPELANELGQIEYVGFIYKEYNNVFKFDKMTEKITIKFNG